jgi:HPt (histidine-containing phosphotransfer) domain-containing protein
MYNENGIKENVCNLSYLSEAMGNKAPQIKGILQAFRMQVPEELDTLKIAIAHADFKTIKSFAHTMMSTVSILGITSLAPILNEMEALGAKNEDLERIKELNMHLVLVCGYAMEEVEEILPAYL